MKSTPYFAAGRFRAEGDRMKVMNPYTGKQVGSVVLAGPEVLDGCIRAGMDALEVLSDTPLHQRSQWLAAIAGEMENSRETLAEILMQESGKPIRLAMGETDRAIQTFRIAAQEVLRQPGEYLPVDWTPAGEGKEAWIRHFPAGIVAGISPFNFPLTSVHTRSLPLWLPVVRSFSSHPLQHRFQHWRWLGLFRRQDCLPEVCRSYP
jgi:glyceraldehyde-3-phosphate dehydrogenase (NADP+)